MFIWLLFNFEEIKRHQMEVEAQVHAFIFDD